MWQYPAHVNFSEWSNQKIIHLYLLKSIKKKKKKNLQPVDKNLRMVEVHTHKGYRNLESRTTLAYSDDIQGCVALMALHFHKKIPKHEYHFCKVSSFFFFFFFLKCLGEYQKILKMGLLKEKKRKQNKKQNLQMGTSFSPGNTPEMQPLTTYISQYNLKTN